MIPDTVSLDISHQQLNLSTIRPIAASEIHGIAFQGAILWAIDTKNGYLLKIDPLTHNTQIVNQEHWEDFIGVTGLAIADDKFWFTSQQNIYYCSLNDQTFTPELFTRLSYPANGMAIWESTVYISCQKTGHILVFNGETKQQITRLYAPGIGIENLTIRGEELWVSDSLEQTVYCLDRATGKIRFSVLTPFEYPTGLGFYKHPQTGEDVLYVAYVNSEPYIRDNPNADPNHELLYRTRTFIHPLYFAYHSEGNYALSNGYLVEMSYVEELAPLDVVELQDLEWRIALPADTHRQKVRKIEPVGLPFTEVVENGQRIAVFKFDTLTPNTRCIFGWKVLLEVWSIKYRLTPKDCENIPDLSQEYCDRYLVDNDDLAMHTDIIQRAAAEAAERETNLLRKVYSIRNYVYDRLSYGIKPHIDTPDIALRRGVGSCGEYVGVLLALFRLNGIACRTVGRYKCPSSPLTRNLPLEPDYNHVWLEFYIPSIGWLPMESNPDDIIEGGPYPTRFFMGLAWYHAEMAKDTPFERLVINGSILNKQQVSIGSVAINHVRFTILEELNPAKNIQVSMDS
ncbi:transglutaminase-like domain-containing protein [Aphanothece sacrum]|uniref:Transglutaminase domain protein n=1 Tax=Aphanothece sacrum FPU1 TaxID=1920663 RepID=A0A401IHM5_APHSA|nr:transglutaminase family protein [Aphanothece sacrum]GBF80744.1 transglutaminase domain protein [Aphanothece sacrum FPU1]GBF83238.1 transglutaminase domain protein [Aphanothece sacrum FPU3]